jgi:hypothetical protein
MTSNEGSGACIGFPPTAGIGQPALRCQKVPVPLTSKDALDPEQAWQDAVVLPSLAK